MQVMRLRQFHWPGTRRGGALVAGDKILSKFNSKAENHEPAKLAIPLLCKLVFFRNAQRRQAFSVAMRSECRA